METIFITGSGKWQRRIMWTLHEACAALTIRQIRIRCGMLGDVHKSCLRTTLSMMVKRGMICRAAYGHYAI